MQPITTNNPQPTTNSKQQTTTGKKNADNYDDRNNSVHSCFAGQFEDHSQSQIASISVIGRCEVTEHDPNTI